MILVVALLMKALAAKLADKRLKIGVYSRVGVQGRATIESLSAGHAFVRLLGGVNDLMPAESARLPKTFAADFADERPGARMHRHVSRKIVVRVENLAAFRAGESLLLDGPELAARCRTLLTALILRRHAGETEPRGGFLNGRWGWRTLRDRWC